LQLLRVNWWDWVTDASALQQTGLTTISYRLSGRCLLFGHVARLDVDVLANMALRLMTVLHTDGKGKVNVDLYSALS